MFKIKQKLNKDKTKIMVAGNPFQIRNIDLPSSLKLYQPDINLSTKLRNIWAVLNENLTLKYQSGAVEKKAIGGLSVDKWVVAAEDSASGLDELYCLTSRERLMEGFCLHTFLLLR